MSKMNKTVCLCGSFRFIKELTKVARELTSKGVICLIPKPFKFDEIVDKINAFQLQTIKNCVNDNISVESRLRRK